jgi:uncharacterized glyoxalase superfamily protein PhnB
VADMDQIVTPYLLYENAEEAAAFLTRAFGFKEVDRQIGAGGGMHLEFETDLGGHVYAGQPTSDYRNPAQVGRTSSVYVIVSGVDAHHNRASDAGATIIEELVDMPFGHRRYGCVDPEGHEWTFAQVIDTPSS